MKMNHTIIWIRATLMAPSLFVLAFASNAYAENVVGCAALTSGSGVRITLSTEIASTVPDVPIGFNAIVTNTNPFPVTDGSVYMQVLKNISKGTTTIADAYLAAEHVSIPPDQSVTIPLTWRVPLMAGSGDYMFNAYYASADQNVFAYPALAAATSSTVRVSVVGNRGAGAEFGLRLKVNAVSHLAGSVIPITDGPVHLEALAFNRSNLPVKGTVVWRLYSWDASRANSLLSQQTQELKIHPNQFSVVQYDLTDTNTPAYYLEGEIDSGAAHSLIGIRLERASAHAVHIQSLGFTGSFAQNTAVANACIRNVGQLSPHERIEVTAGDPSPFAQSIATALSTSSMSLPLTPIGNSGFGTVNDFYLTAKIYNGSNVEDTLTVHYDCAALNTCAKEHPQGLSATLIVSIMGVLIAIAIVGIIIYIRRRALRAGVSY